MYIRRVGNQLEISWNNRHPYEDDNRNRTYSLQYKRGVEYIDIHHYTEVILQFCWAYITQIQSEYRPIAKQYLKNLQKVIDMVF